jgi:hypothetical protein
MIYLGLSSVRDKHFGALDRVVLSSLTQYSAISKVDFISSFIFGPDTQGLFISGRTQDFLCQNWGGERIIWVCWILAKTRPALDSRRNYILSMACLQIKHERRHRLVYVRGFNPGEIHEITRYIHEIIIYKKQILK